MAAAAPLAVLHLLPTLSLGGAELHVARLCAGWQGTAVRPLVVAMHRGGPVEERLRADAVPFEVVGIQRAPITRPFAAWRDARRLQSAVVAAGRRHGAALLQTHLSDADWIGLAAGRELRVPVVITCHDPHLLPQERAAGEWRARLRRLLQARSWRRADAFIAISDGVARAIAQVPGVDPARVHVIPSGFVSRPLPSAERRAAARARHAALLGDAAQVVLAVGRLVENKGTHQLLDAFAHVVASHPRTRLWIAGDGPERAALAARIERLGLVRHALLLGACDDVPELQACADLFATATRYEGLGLAAAEAQDQGLPVVAFRVTGIEEVVRHDETGLLVPPGDCRAMAAALIALLDDPARRAAFSAAARPSAQRFEITHSRAATWRLYRRLTDPSAAL